MSSTILRWVAPIAFLAIMLGGIGVAQATGQWVTSGRQQVTAGQVLTPDDLRGWMTLGVAAEGLGMPEADLIALVGAPDGVTLTGDVAFKDLEALVPGFELTAFRELLADPATAATPTVIATPSPVATAPGAASAAPSSHEPEPTSTGAPGGVTGAVTLREVAQANNLDPAELVAAAGLPTDVALDTPLRELRDVVAGFEIQGVRDAVAALG